MNKLLLGRYLNGKSLIHRMDPRSKLMMSFYFICIIFLANNWITYGILLLLSLCGIVLSKIKLSFFFRGIIPLIWLILFTVALQVFFTPGGHVIWSYGPFTLSKLGIVNGLYVFCRFVLIIVMSTLLTLTTAPLEIADAVEALIKPLRYLKVPVHEIALMLSIALRFVPTLMDETVKIMNAQKSRGVNFGEGSIINRIKAVIPILIPLFVSAFNRAEDLAVAMEARGYRGGDGRTKFRVMKWHRRDTGLIIIFIIITILLLIFRNY